MEHAPEATKLRKLGVSFRKIAAALGTEEKLIRKALEYAKDTNRPLTSPLPLDREQLVSCLIPLGAWAYTSYP